MNAPTVEDLWPFSNLPREQFEVLHRFYCQSGGKLEVAVEIPIDDLNALLPHEYPDHLFWQGYLTRKRVKGLIEAVNLTRRGGHEVIFATHKERRHRIMTCMYMLSEAAPSVSVPDANVCEELKIPLKRLWDDWQYLQGRDLVKLQGLSGRNSVAVLTANGIAVVEGAADTVSKIIQMTVHGDVRHNSDNNSTSGSNSPVQSRSSDSSQSVTTESDEATK